MKQIKVIDLPNRDDVIYHLNQLCSTSEATGQGIHTSNMSDKDVFNISALPPPIILQQNVVNM